MVERHEPVWDDREHKWALDLSILPRLAQAEARLWLRGVPPADAVVVGYPGHPDLWAARRAARGRPVVFNPLVALSDTFVIDRGRFPAGSLTARALRALDRAALRAADLVVADTEAHAHLFRELGARTVETIFVGAEAQWFQPGWHAAEPFTCLFVGKLAPLQGLETILAVSRAAPELHFRIVASGQREALLESAPANVERLAWVPYERLAAEYHRASCALGIFGTTPKARRVIPNKVFQALACGVPVVTADTPAVRELLRDGESALLVPPGDGTALAVALRRLRDDPALARRIADGGLAAFRERASEDVLGARWRSLLERLV